jgi:hypothetical protein
MSQVKKIECLQRLNALSGAVGEIMTFLVGEKLIDLEGVKKISQSSDRAKDMYMFLANLSKTDKIQMLEYEWTILPIERIKITIVTNMNSKEFTHNF